MTNYFELFNLPPAFDLDLKQLEAAYFAAQKQYHPDRFIGKPDSERQAAMQRSSEINQAYDTLKYPLSRAQYLLFLQGIEVGTEEGGVQPSPEVLMESMEWRERIADALELKPLAEELGRAIEASIASLAGHYKKRTFGDMAQETLRLTYLMRANQELRRRKL